MHLHFLQKNHTGVAYSSGKGSCRCLRQQQYYQESAQEKLVVHDFVFQTFLQHKLYFL